MTLITITLTEGEQKVLLDLQRLRFPNSLVTIAEKIRKTRKAEEMFREAYEQPDTTACGLCQAPKESHDADDHHWQWNLAPVREAYVTRTGKVLTDADLKRYADEAETGYDLPGEPAG